MPNKLHIGLAQEDPLSWDERTWDGLNLLGEALDAARARMKTSVPVKTMWMPWMVMKPRKQRVALMVGRFQPLHRAHCMVIERMLQDNDVVIVGIGSSQDSRSQRNPYHADIRMAMLRNVFGDRIKIIPLRDLGSGIHTQEWVNNVIGKCAEAGLPEPNRYYCGCHDDSLWYQGYFSGVNPEKVVNGDMIIYRHPQEDRELVILERTMNHYPSATRIREYINLRMPDWQWYIPERNHVLVEANYPAEFRTALSGDEAAMHTATTMPDGTHFQRTDMDPPMVFQKLRGLWKSTRQSISVVDE